MITNDSDFTRLKYRESLISKLIFYESVSRNVFLLQCIWYFLYAVYLITDYYLHVDDRGSWNNGYDIGISQQFI